MKSRPLLQRLISHMHTRLKTQQKIHDIGGLLAELAIEAQ